MRRRDKSGFTLIELLVVIAIIAILAAILFPVFLSAKERARIGQCVSHQKQLGAAFLAYADDNDGRTCMSYNLPGTGQGKYWSQALYPYTSKNAEIFYCAGLKNRRGRDIFDGVNYNAAWGVTTGLNIVVGDPPAGTWPIKIVEYGSPTRTLVFACSSASKYLSWDSENRDSGHYVISPGMKSQPLLCLAPRIGVPVRSRAAGRGWWYDFFDENRHNGNVVVTHLDGHVKVYSRDYVLTPNRVAKTWKDPRFSIWDDY